MMPNGAALTSPTGTVYELAGRAKAWDKRPTVRCVAHIFLACTRRMLPSRCPLFAEGATSVHFRPLPGSRRARRHGQASQVYV